MTLKQDLMLILSNADKPMLVSDLASMLGRDPYNLSRVLKRMWEDKEVKRLYGPGRSYMWAVPTKKFRDTYRPKRKRTEKESVHTQARPNINPETLRGLLNNWAEKKWVPKVYRSTQNLPLALGKLYELSAEVGFGSIIPQKELDYYRDQLQILVDDALALYLISSTIIEKQELWNAESLPMFLLTESSDPIKLQTLAKQLRELNT